MDLDLNMEPGFGVSCLLIKDPQLMELDLNMEAPAITNLGGSLINTDEVNLSQKQKGAQKNNKRGHDEEGEDPDFSQDYSSPKTDAATNHPFCEAAALPYVLSSQKDVEFDSTNKSEKKKRQKTKLNAIESNINRCSALDETFLSKISSSALDEPSELPIQCVSPGFVTKESCVEKGNYEEHKEEKEKKRIKTKEICSDGHNEEKEQNMSIQEVNCNNILVVASPELSADKKVVNLNIERGVNDESSNLANKSDFVRSTSLVKKRKFSDSGGNSGYKTPENCIKKSTMQDHHMDDSYILSDEPFTVGLINGGAKLSSDQHTSQSGAAADIKLRTDNTNIQRFIATSSVVDVPMEQPKINHSGHSEIERNDLCCTGDVSDLSLVAKISQFSLDRTVGSNSKNKLLILDVNGLLADFVSEIDNPRRHKYRQEPEPDIWLKGKKVYKRPFCDDFLQFCFDRFHVGVWSSRTKKNVDEAIKFLTGESSSKLLFCWNQSHCTKTRFSTVENKSKPLVLKELRKLWEKDDPDLPWEKGVFNESNTLLLDDSPYKALLNPKHTAIFPYSYRYYDTRDSAIGPGGDLRVYLEGLATADNIQEYVSANPFGQRPIRETNPSWGYYRKVIASLENNKNA